jgi:hypothetical protein
VATSGIKIALRAATEWERGSTKAQQGVVWPIFILVFNKRETVNYLL